MAKELLHGTMIVIGMRWTDRVIGLLSTMVLARLLVPADFGVVAMASMYAGLVDVLLDLGVAATLIQKRDCDAEDYNTAWTIRLIQTAMVAIIIASTAPWVALYFHEPKLEEALLVTAISSAVSGLENIGTVTYQKEMRFGKDFQFLVTKRLIGFFATIALAWYLRSYWALFLGALIGRLGGVALSYLMHDMRPRLSLQRVRAVWSVSQWMLLRGIGGYLNERLDKILVGGRVDAATLGAYSLADEIAAMTTTELISPMGRVLFPAFVSVRNNLVELRRVFLLSVGVQWMIALPASVGLALVAPDAIVVLLGDRWTACIPFVQLLAPTYGILATAHGAGYVLTAIGHIRVHAYLMWLQIGLFGFVSLTLLASADPLSLAGCRLVIAVLFAVAFIFIITRLVEGLQVRALIDVLWRPAFAVTTMSLVLLALPPSSDPDVASLFWRCAIGAAVYVPCVIGLWWLAGKPVGSETYFVALLSRRAKQ